MLAGYLSCLASFQTQFRHENVIHEGRLSVPASPPPALFAFLAQIDTFCSSAEEG